MLVLSWLCVGAFVIVSGFVIVVALSLWSLCHVIWLFFVYHCDGFIFVMALSLFRLLHQAMWHITVGLFLSILCLYH